ncbi:E3 ubiquitin-protein ligase TRIM39-like [Esox lucius]|uniref:E3 ubiquitin-protein ligase TRIM39-like n=1 Tax=Esox lucius TaxID=8010 RepID=UPI001476E2D6|nr:E3 ubiquitin-protein ligase TRIM39-like [Esox lucius]
MKSNSVCPGEDVCSVLEDLERQWDSGTLPSMLPVMDFLIWTVLQQQPHQPFLQGSIEKQWLMYKHMFRSRVALNRIPDTVWRWILKASAKITLDPSTANPNLLLSADNQRLTMGTIIESVYNPWDHCEITSNMYSGWWCVLGTEGFTSGRHYWEVGVKGKSEWRIGVVRESAPRHGFTHLNTQTGYWTLRLQLGELMAVTTPVTKLTQCVPSKVGVYLDLEEGQVSFYDAEKRLHIYTFYVDFDLSENIYPMFHTTETKRELVLLGNK